MIEAWYLIKIVKFKKKHTFRELMLEAENLKCVDRNQLQFHVTGKKSVQNATERYE